MRRSLLLGYQLLTGLSDASTGLLLVFAPGFTLRLMRLSVPDEALPYLSYLGVFVLSVGVACLYGAVLATRVIYKQKLEVVWLLTGVTRFLVMLFIVAKVSSGTLESGWATVAITDGAFALVQAIGLARGWLADGAA
jgi:Na+/H+ antiporter NhaA